MTTGKIALSQQADGGSVSSGALDAKTPGFSLKHSLLQ
jgi:hypothetical protein